MLTEDEGVTAIQTLLSIYGLSEPVERSRKNWQNMDEMEKLQTEEAYKMFVKNIN